MADSNPFAHLGQGFLGSDVGIARQAATPQPLFDNNPLKGLLAEGLDKIGVIDFLNSLGSKKPEGKTNAPIAPPQVQSSGINPVAMSNQAPGGLGLNVKPAQNPFVSPNAPTAYGQEDETRNQIRSAWGNQ